MGRRAVAAIVGELGTGAAVALVEAMSLTRAAEVLNVAAPDVAARVLRVSPGGRGELILAGLGQAARAQVRRLLET